MIYSENDILYSIKNITDFVDQHNSIGLFCSGGFDSTVLTYTVFKYLHDIGSEKSIKIYTVPRSDNSINHAKRILAVLSSIFKDVKYQHIILTNNDVPHNLIVYRGMAEVISNTEDWIIISDTKNPECLPNGPGRRQTNLPRQYHPLLSYYKTMTLQMAKYYDILSLISEITHTCTESTSIRCGKCWQCNERKWAFNQLGVEDLKTL
jgi:7-cyano-7-deazaguanine synthase in queuosine biosynthesis